MTEALAEALREIARQKKTDEQEYESDEEYGDFEGGYDACIDTARAALAAYDAAPAPDLSDPNVVHLNMLRGTIAKPTVDQIIHIYGIDALCKALAPQIVREAALKELADLGQAWDAAPGPAVSDDFAAGMRRAVYEGMRIATTVPVEQVPEAISTFLASIPAAGAWEPPADRRYGFECFGFVDANRLQTMGYGGWEKVAWGASPLVDGHWYIRHSGEEATPTAFWPLPPAPAGEGEG